MRLDTGTLRLSASDLMRFMACPHATALDLLHLQGQGPEPAPDSEDAALLQRQGDAHEADWLEKLKAEGRRVAEIEKDGLPFAASVVATKQALLDGPDVVFQGALEGGVWGGYSDFLERVERPSALGAHSWEVADTKLKRKPAPSHILQLVLYSDLLEPLQGRAPERAHVQLGNGERFSFRLAEYADYARAARARLEDFVSASEDTAPIPCATCGLCRWREHCSREWEKRDSLHLVAGITKTQVARLEAQGISTMAALAEQSAPVPRIARETLDKLVTQARLQQARKSGDPTHELRPEIPGKGFDLLPAPADGDLFYDIEGDPHYAEAGNEGLEYLHGVWDGSTFTALWAHDHAEEKAALESLFALFEVQITRFPQARIYHYAPYEITALRRLTTRHGIGEAQLDRWLRENRFCDLYAVVRGGVFASEPSYSIKDMEAFYDMPRTGEVKTAGGSVVAYEAWRNSDDQTILDEIQDYNRIDCVSTEKLRDWLIGIRPEGRAWFPLGEAETEKSAAQDEALQELADRLATADLNEDRRNLLFDLGVFHAREKKPAAWSVFDAATKSFEDLSDDLECLAGLRALSPQEAVKSSWARHYTYPPQETKLRAGKSVQVALGEGRFVGVKIEAMDRRKRQLTLKIGMKQEVDLPDRLDLLPSFALRTEVIEEAIRTVIEDQCGPRANMAAEDLLSRNPPRLTRPLASLSNPDPVKQLCDAATAMENTVLPVQGPPGTGKTYVTARAILSLVRQGKRVGVASNSHAAIRNVLMGCIDALRDDDVDLTVEDVELAHKIGADMEPLPEGYEAIRNLTKSASDGAYQSAHVVGGTAWLFSHPNLAGAFDYLFVDEAGQVSLANMLAMSNAARNLVLVGDPRQLPQVIQGAHPWPANLSCLDWILQDQTVVSPDRGIFLGTTRRMHPELCRYVSGQFYEGQLAAHESTAVQSVSATGLPRQGAFRIEVAHEGRAQECPEEVDAIRACVKRLLSGTWTDKDGTTRPMRPSDIVIVAPYNAQVNALSDALPGLRVGTVDRFQGQEAPIALVSMTASSAEETSRGLDFLLSRERLNVAISRGKALSLVFTSPRLLQTPCTTVDQMRLVNTLCALPPVTDPRELNGASTSTYSAASETS